MATMTRNATQSDFQPCPEGQWPAVLCDIVDLGWFEVVFEGNSQGLRPHCQLVFQAHAVNEETNEPETFLVFDKRMKWSFDQKANLYKRLASWLSTKRLDAMLDANEDIETLLDQPAYINVVHNTAANGNVYANVEGIMPLPKGLPYPTVEGYTRRCDREDWASKKPMFSAFEPLPQGVIIGADGKPETNPNSNSHRAAQQVNRTVQPNAPVASTAIPNGPMTPKTMAKLLSIANQKFGPLSALTRLNEWLGKDLGDLTEEEACAKLQPLADYIVPPADDDDDGADIFDNDPAQANPNPPKSVEKQAVAA